MTTETDRAAFETPLRQMLPPLTAIRRGTFSLNDRAEYADHAMEQDWRVFLRGLAHARAESKVALERLASMEAMTGSRSIELPQDAELIARIDFARAALAKVQS